ncbi:DUF2393 domain-containing protein [Helicobacter apodemus]|uniref:DUF2393 domain-containing protein n=1 Tax=Helicobacter apodemus TaxID=135569 RepID=A0A4U8UG38_9HELI|nr:DUF2393 family protein [Helicobacter apodemus]TLE17184.1 DUF2393 domain-containing protein [Helicobacter apodemus]
MDIVSLKATIASFMDFAEYFSLPDYLILTSGFLVLLLLLLLFVALRSYFIVAFVVFLVGLILFFLSPLVYQVLMTNVIRKVEITLKFNQKMYYDDSYFVEGSLVNKGIIKFRGCVISVNFVPKGIKKLQALRYEIKPIYKHLQVYENPLNVDEKLDFKILIPSPNPEVLYFLNTRGSCY